VPDIDWSAFDWSAFATSVTGVLVFKKRKFQ